MQIEIFTRLVPRSQDLYEHLKPLEQLPEEQYELVLPFLLNLSLAEGDAQLFACANEVLSQLPIEPNKAATAISALLALINEWTGILAPPKNIADELVALGVLRPEAPALRAFLVRVFEELYENRLRFLTRMYSLAGIPSLSSCSALVDVRAVFEPYTHSEAAEEAIDPDPDIAGWIPLATVKIHLSDGRDPSFIDFQCTEAKLDELIDDLSRTKAEITAVKQRLSVYMGEQRKGK